MQPLLLTYCKSQWISGCTVPLIGVPYGTQNLLQRDLLECIVHLLYVWYPLLVTLNPEWNLAAFSRSSIKLNWSEVPAERVPCLCHSSYGRMTRGNQCCQRYTAFRLEWRIHCQKFLGLGEFKMFLKCAVVLNWLQWNKVKSIMQTERKESSSESPWRVCRQALVTLFNECRRDFFVCVWLLLGQNKSF